MENKLWISLIVVLIGFVMIGESSFLEGANDGGIKYEMIENLEEAASLAAQLEGKGICCSGSSCIGGTCTKQCKDLGQECGLFGKGICCSDSSCIGGTCTRTCKELGQECGLFGKGICCSDSSCIGGTCTRQCKAVGQECGIFGKGIPFTYWWSLIVL